MLFAHTIISQSYIENKPLGVPYHNNSDIIFIPNTSWTLLLHNNK